MTVDFALRKAPEYRVASIRWSGPWSESRIRSRFGEIVRWAAERRLRTGRWIFREPGERRWEVCVEVRGRARSSGRIRVKTLPASLVASVVFDPEAVSPRVVYHGLSDWVRWRRRDKTIRSASGSREVYRGDPWRDPKAWAHTEVQFLVRK